MNYVAIKMLVGDLAKYLGMIFGVTIASLLIMQQASIFVGLMARTYGFLSDTSYPQLWIMDSKVQFIDDIKPLQETQLYRIRGVEGIDWAAPLYKGLIKARLPDGTFQTCNVIGLDDATLIGAPPTVKREDLEKLRESESVIVDINGAHDKLAHKTYDKDGNEITSLTKPLQVGESLELNDRRANVVAMCEVTRTFQSQPVIYTTYTRAMQFAPKERKLLSFIVAGVKPGTDIAEVQARINQIPGLQALTREEFMRKTYIYFMKYTGIPINFGISIVLGFIVGTAIAGLLFYQFAQDNLKHFGSLKAMGAGNMVLLRMILLQATMVGFIGYGFGAALTSIFGLASGKSELAFLMVWQIPVITAVAIMLIVLLSAGVALIKVMRLEPAIVFKG